MTWRICPPRPPPFESSTVPPLCFAGREAPSVARREALVRGPEPLDQRLAAQRGVRHRQLAEQQVRLDGQHRRLRRPRGCRLPEAVHARCGLGQLAERESRAGYMFERSAHCPVLDEAEKGAEILQQDVLAGLTVLAGAVSLGFRECWPCVRPVPA
jgi:hypothetical protein